MAEEFRTFDVVVPAGTAKATPQLTKLTLPVRVVDEIEIRVPPGPRGEVGFAIGSSGVQVIPMAIGSWIVTDDEEINWRLENFWDSGAWEVRAYNTGQFDHTLYLRFLLSTIGKGGPPAPSSISSDVLNTGGPGAGTLPPAGLVELPPLVVPELPPLPLPPTLPPAPGIPGVPGPQPGPPQPKYNWWNDAMGKLLTWPDQVNTTRFDEVFVKPDGSVGWYAWQQGAGQWTSWDKKSTDLGGGVVDVSACFSLYQGVIRLNVVGTTADGTRWLKVMNAQSFAPILDWTAQPPGQDRELALSKAAGVG